MCVPRSDRLCGQNLGGGASFYDYHYDDDDDGDYHDYDYSR